MTARGETLLQERKQNQFMSAEAAEAGGSERYKRNDTANFCFMAIQTTRDHASTYFKLLCFEQKKKHH